MKTKTDRPTKLKTPITWIGGKHYLAKKIIDYFPEHKTYVELFGGGGSVLFQKPPSKVEVFNDINSDLINFFRIIRDKEKFKEFYEIINLVPYSREEFKNSIETISNGNDIERAVKFFIVARMSFAGNFGRSWSYSKFTSSGGIAKHVNAWLNAIDLLPEISERLKKVQIENQDYKIIMENFDDPNIFIYADPPYLNVKSKFKTYNTWSEEEHKEFLNICLKSKSKIMISGYYSDLYNEKLNSWSVKTFKYANFATKIINKKRSIVDEYIWMNYDAPKKPSYLKFE